MIKALIVEDEAVAARRLKTMVEKHSDISVVGMLDSLEELREWIDRKDDVDLFFFDIQLSDGIIFELFETRTVEKPIIFTTAYDAYAIKAFKQNSIDYLLKPIDDEDLSRALQKYRSLNKSPEIDLLALKALITPKEEVSYRERILVKIADQLRSIPLSEVSHIYSEDKATWVAHEEGRTYPIDTTLNEIKKQLDPQAFFQINRGCIVHVTHILKIHQHSSSRLKLHVQHDDSERMAVARDRVGDFKVWLDR